MSNESDREAPEGEAVTWNRVEAPQKNRLGFVVDEVVLGQVFLRVLRFPPISVIPPTLNAHSSFTKAT
jgi:hypothetical protein